MKKITKYYFWIIGYCIAAVSILVILIYGIINNKILRLPSKTSPFSLKFATYEADPNHFKLYFIVWVALFFAFIILIVYNFLRINREKKI